MARIRFVKPEFFDDPDIGALSPIAALIFIGLWTQADREGRLLDDYRRVKTRLAPYWDVDAEAVLKELAAANFIVRYTDSTGRKLLQIRSFGKHQRPHPKETASVLEGPAVKLHGSPLNLTASKPDSGFLILDSGVRSTGNTPSRSAGVPRRAATRTYSKREPYEAPTQKDRRLQREAEWAAEDAAKKATT